VTLIAISPFIASHLGIIGSEGAFYCSLGVIVIVLFFLGTIIGRVAKEDRLKSGINMLFAGISVAVLVCLLDFLKFL